MTIKGTSRLYDMAKNIKAGVVAPRNAQPVHLDVPTQGGTKLGIVAPQNAKLASPSTPPSNQQPKK